MEIWPKALNRRFYAGQVEEIVPFDNEVLEGGGVITDIQDGNNAEQMATPPPPPVTQPGIAFEDVRLKLTTTAIFGKSRYARINGEKVVVGQEIEVQVGSETIRYEVSAINSREVEIRYSGETYFLRIDVPGPLNRAQDGA